MVLGVILKLRIKELKSEGEGEGERESVCEWKIKG